MAGNKPLSVAIATPTYNEAKNIKTLLSQIDAAVRHIADTQFTVYVIDDSSPDGTAAIAEAQAKKLTSKNLTVSVLVKKKKEGLGKAYVWAFHQILKTKQFDYVISMDADLSHDPKHLATFARLAHEGEDVVVASRYVRGGATPDWSLKRKLLSRFGNFYIRFFLGSRIADWTGGYNMYRAELLARLDLDSLPGGYSFLLSLKNMALKRTQKIRQFPIVFLDRTEGVSKIPKDTMRTTLQLVPVLALRGWHERKLPLKALVVVLAILGFGVLAALMFLYVAGNPNFLNNWPLSWELSYVDPPFLWHFAQNFFDGTPILFMSSGQAFAFPEIPVSLLAYLLAHGSIYFYYLIVAMINMMAIFSLIIIITFRLFEQHSFWQKLARAFLAATPLLVVLVVGQIVPMYMVVAPTYNFDIDFGAFLLGAILVARTRRWKLFGGVLYILTAMSNMLLIVMSVPILLIILAVTYVKDGWRATVPGLIKIIVVVGVSMALNHYLFGMAHPGWPVAIRTATTSSYFNLDQLEGHLQLVFQHFSRAFQGDTSILVALIACALSIGGALYAMRRLIQKADRRVTRGQLYLYLLPTVGVVSAYLLTILYEYYLWLPLVGSMIVILLLLVPRRIVVGAAVIALLSLALFVVGNRHQIAASRTVYFGYQSALARCVDAGVPANSYIYASWSHGKVAPTMSHKNIRTLQSNPDYTPNQWLNNVLEDKAVTTPIHYVLIGYDTNPAVTASYEAGALKVFGTPQHVTLCDDDSHTAQGELWYYSQNIFINQ